MRRHRPRRRPVPCRLRGRPQRRDPVEELAHDQWLVTHQDDRLMPEVRRTLDRIAAALAPHRG